MKMLQERLLRIKGLQTFKLQDMNHFHVLIQTEHQLDFLRQIQMVKMFQEQFVVEDYLKNVPLDGKFQEIYLKILDLPSQERIYLLIELVKDFKIWNVGLTKKSTFLSLVLRHDPKRTGIEMDSKGWVKVSDVCRWCPISQDELQEIVQTDETGRYSFSTDLNKIRANQGHSIKVDIDLTEAEPPEFLWHGTATKSLDSIMSQGLVPMNRQYVHLSSDKE